MRIQIMDQTPKRLTRMDAHHVRRQICRARFHRLNEHRMQIARQKRQLCLGRWFVRQVAIAVSRLTLGIALVLF